MGLNQRNQRHLLASHLQRWALPGFIIIVASLLALCGDWGRELLRFDRDAIAGGEIWRLASGHFVHLGLSHWILNGAGLLLVWFLVGEFLRTGQWLVVTLISILGMDIGFWFLQPQLQWYVGLSGLLHGFLFAGIVAGYRKRRHEQLSRKARDLAERAMNSGRDMMTEPLPADERILAEEMTAGSSFW